MSDKKHTESNIISYVRQCMSTFDEMELTEVDSLVLSAFSYLKLPEFLCQIHYPQGIPLRDFYCSEYFEDMFANVYQADYYKELFFAMAASPRYRNLLLSDYVNLLNPDTNLQFAAVSIRISPTLTYVSFRGTDSTFTGWKEDLNMSRNEPIPGQIEAFNYLESILCHYNNTIIVGGHSKGGNLATFASACVIQKHLDYNKQIQAIYSHDGPGFPAFFTENIAFYLIEDKIHKTLPQDSLVGQILNQEAHYHVIKSLGKSGIEQHSPFTWVIENNHFISLDSLSEQTKLFCESITQWNEQLDDADRDRMIDTIFRIFDSADVDNFNDLSSDIQHQVSLMLKELKALDPDTRSFLIDQLKDLAHTGIKTAVPESIQEKSEWIAQFPHKIQTLTSTWLSNVPSFLQNKVEHISMLSDHLKHPISDEENFNASNEKDFSVSNEKDFTVTDKKDFTVSDVDESDISDKKDISES